MRRKSLSLITALAMVVAVVSPARSAIIPGFPAIGVDSGANQGPGILITIDAMGVASVSSTGNPPYDNIEDTYVGVINNYSGPISTIHLKSSTTIFGFDGDGIAAAFISPNVAGNGNDPSGYGGPNAFFTNILANLKEGDVNFINPIQPGGRDFFGLEERLDAASFVATPVGVRVPEPTSLVVFGLAMAGAAGFARKRKAKATA